MSGIDREIDVQFFELIHSLQTNQPILHSDRRRVQRMYSGKNCRIAPYDRERGFPPEEEFFQVFCYDLTRQGLGYFCDAPPGYTRIVVELSKNETSLFLEGEVRRCDRVVILANGAVGYLPRRDDSSCDSKLTAGGTPQYLVGCQFIQRLQPTWEPGEKSAAPAAQQAPPTADSDRN